MRKKYLFGYNAKKGLDIGQTEDGSRLYDQRAYIGTGSTPVLFSQSTVQNAGTNILPAVFVPRQVLRPTGGGLLPIAPFIPIVYGFTRPVNSLGGDFQRDINVPATFFSPDYTTLFALRALNNFMPAGGGFWAYDEQLHTVSVMSLFGSTLYLYDFDKPDSIYLLPDLDNNGDNVYLGQSSMVQLQIINAYIAPQYGHSNVSASQSGQTQSFVATTSPNANNPALTDYFIDGQSNSIIGNASTSGTTGNVLYFRRLVLVGSNTIAETRITPAILYNASGTYNKPSTPYDLTYIGVNSNSVNPILTLGDLTTANQSGPYTFSNSIVDSSSETWSTAFPNGETLQESYSFNYSFSYNLSGNYTLSYDANSSPNIIDGYTGSGSYNYSGTVQSSLTSDFVEPLISNSQFVLYCRSQEQNSIVPTNITGSGNSSTYVPSAPPAGSIYDYNTTANVYLGYSTSLPAYWQTTPVAEPSLTWQHTGTATFHMGEFTLGTDFWHMLYPNVPDPGSPSVGATITIDVSSSNLINILPKLNAISYPRSLLVGGFQQANTSTSVHELISPVLDSPAAYIEFNAGASVGNSTTRLFRMLAPGEHWFTLPDTFSEPYLSSSMFTPAPILDASIQNVTPIDPSVVFGTNRKARLSKYDASTNRLEVYDLLITGYGLDTVIATILDYQPSVEPFDTLAVYANFWSLYTYDKSIDYISAFTNSLRKSDWSFNSSGANLVINHANPRWDPGPGQIVVYTEQITVSMDTGDSGTPLQTATDGTEHGTVDGDPRSFAAHIYSGRQLEADYTDFVPEAATTGGQDGGGGGPIN